MDKRNSNTINYYNENAKSYFDLTVNVDMSILYGKFLLHLPNHGYILDFGCGSGRDSKYFIDHGYKVRAVDGSIKLCELASSYLGQEVECMNFSDFNDQSLYDGVWACSSIIHLPQNELIDTLKRISRSLKDDGVVYVSFKSGIGDEIINGRYFNYMTKDAFIHLLTYFPELKLVDIFENLLTINCNEARHWNNFVLRKGI